ncbi:hypothetical protein GGR58DRAFT_420770 [Xylaria digitata]|nr:hypothetical protein GGR58DRAFT_420770 [Xylaria digitata]
MNEPPDIIIIIILVPTYLPQLPLQHATTLSEVENQIKSDLASFVLFFLRRRPLSHFLSMPQYITCIDELIYRDILSERALSGTLFHLQGSTTRPTDRSSLCKPLPPPVVACCSRRRCCYCCYCCCYYGRYSFDSRACSLPPYSPFHLPIPHLQLNPTTHIHPNLRSLLRKPSTVVTYNQLTTPFNQHRLDRNHSILRPR